MEKEIKFTSYTFTQRMGMEGVGDMEQEYMSPAEITESIRQDKERIEKLKASGQYGKEYTTTIRIETDPILDRLEWGGGTSTSYKMEIINLSDEDNSSNRKP